MKNLINHIIGTQTSLIIYFGCIMLLAGCMEHEIPVTPHVPGEVEITNVTMGSDYGTQKYYNLSTREVVASNDNYDWDIALKCAMGNNIVRLNSSKFMSVSKTASLYFTEDISEKYVSSLEYTHEYESGQNADFSIGDVSSEANLMILKLGYDIEDNEIGYYRLMIDSVNNDGYFIRYADLELTYDSTVFIPRNDDIEWIHFSMITHEVLQLEPETGDWDLLFTRYTELLDGETNYQVVGVLSPPNGTLISDISQFSFNEIKEANWDTLDFTSNWNEIGYDWKLYDMTVGEYTVDAERCFAIHCPDGREFVIRFLDFYDEMGNLGSITFESAER